MATRHTEISVPQDSRAADPEAVNERAIAIAAEDAARAKNLARQHEHRAKAAQVEINDNTIENGISREEAYAAEVERRYADAMSIGDFVAAGRHQRELFSSQGRIDVMREGLNELREEVRPQLVRQGNVVSEAAPPPQRQPQQPPTVEQVIASMPNLIDSERKYIRDHPDSVDGRENQMRMQTAFLDATKRGLERGSPEYFAFFSERMGYDDAGGAYEPEPRRVAAPVARSNGGGGGPRLREGQVRLSPAQLDAARFSNVTPEEYARGVQAMMKMKSQGMYGMSEQK